MKNLANGGTEACNGKQISIGKTPSIREFEKGANMQRGKRFRSTTKNRVRIADLDERRREGDDPSGGRSAATALPAISPFHRKPKASRSNAPFPSSLFQIPMKIPDPILFYIIYHLRVPQTHVTSNMFNFKFEDRD